MATVKYAVSVCLLKATVFPDTQKAGKKNLSYRLFVIYSYRNASIGFIFAALLAG